MALVGGSGLSGPLLRCRDTTEQRGHEVTDDRRLTALTMGTLIGAALIEDDISQAEFCRRVGTSPKHLNQVVNGNATASYGQLDYWAFALGRRWSVALERES